MGIYKQFKTYIRKKIGLVGVGEFVDDPIDANTKNNWNNWFSNPKYVSEYACQTRISSLNEIVEIMSKYDRFQKSESILDAGCGTGHLLSIISQKFSNKKLFGTDFSQESINISKSIVKNATFSLMDIYNIDDCKGKYDVVICSEVLEHLLYPEKAIENLKLLVNNNGLLVFTVPDGRIDNYSGHINFWSPESWKVFIEKFTQNYGICNFGKFHNNKNNYVVIEKSN